MDETPLLVSRSPGIVSLTLNRPLKRNALTRELLTDLLGQLRTLRNESSPARLLILQSSGSVFCAGMDLSQMQSAAESPAAQQIWQQDADVYRDVVWELFSLPLPTLAVVQGPALAGGVGLVLACDLVLASTGAAFGLPEPQRGITAAVVTPLLNYRLGAGAAGYVLLSGQTLTGENALQNGLIHKLLPADQLAIGVQTLTKSILTGAPGALATAKRSLIECAGPTLRAQLDAAATVSATARETPEAREGLAAFLEKRPPAWQTSH